MVSVTVLGARSLFRTGLVDLLGAIGFDPIDEADDISELRGRLGDRPSRALLITALERGAASGSMAVRAIGGWISTAKIVCLAPEFDLEQMFGCFAAGASGYLLESISRDALRESLRLVDAGEKVFPSELALQFARLSTAGGPPRLPPSNAPLSSREYEILQGLANGQSNKAIARSLDIAEATVKVHVKRILRKANAANRTQAALWAIATGVATPPRGDRAESAAA